MYNHFLIETNRYMQNIKWANVSTRKNPSHYSNCHQSFHLDDPT
jgi:hypothetical protein